MGTPAGPSRALGRDFLGCGLGSGGSASPRLIARLSCISAFF